MIHEYDFKALMNEAVTEEGIRQRQWHTDYKPSVQEILKQLQETLKDEDTVQGIWPESQNLADKEMFSHLNFEIDLANKKVIAETAAKDFHGKPLYSYDF